MTDAPTFYKDTDEFLEHFGIKGMKWGVRHVVGPSGRVLQKRTLSTSKDYADVAQVRKKHVSEMSNEELRKLTTRMNLEQQYKKLNPDTVSKGKKIVAGFIATTAAYVTIYKFFKSPEFKKTVDFGKKVLKVSDHAGKHVRLAKVGSSK